MFRAVIPRGAVTVKRVELRDEELPGVVRGWKPILAERAHVERINMFIAVVNYTRRKVEVPRVRPVTLVELNIKERPLPACPRDAATTREEDFVFVILRDVDFVFGHTPVWKGFLYVRGRKFLDVLAISIMVACDTQSEVFKLLQ